jgi:hypothetical protein
MGGGSLIDDIVNKGTDVYMKKYCDADFYTPRFKHL